MTEWNQTVLDNKHEPIQTFLRSKENTGKSKRTLNAYSRILQKFYHKHFPDLTPDSTAASGNADTNMNIYDRLGQRVVYDESRTRSTRRRSDIESPAHDHNTTQTTHHMSTRTDATPDAASTSPRIDETTDFSRPEPTSEPERDSPSTDVSWTAQCQRQFSSADKSRCKNLADDENEAMHGGV